MAPVSTLSRNPCWGKLGCCRGMYCCLVALMGAPMVPDGWYRPPGHMWGGLRMKNGSGENFRRAWLDFTFITNLGPILMEKSLVNSSWLIWYDLSVKLILIPFLIPGAPLLRLPKICRHSCSAFVGYCVQSSESNQTQKKTSRPKAYGQRFPRPARRGTGVAGWPSGLVGWACWNCFPSTGFHLYQAHCPKTLTTLL